MENESLIDRYFENTLTPQQKTLFDHLLKTDETFAAAVAFEEKTKIAITLENREILKIKLQNLEKKPRNKTSKTWLYIAASTILLLGVSLFFMNQTPSNEKLFASYFEPYPNTVAPIVRSSAQKDLKQDAFVAYEHGEYQRAAQLFHGLTKITNEEYAPFYNAISLMMLDDIEAASTIFETTQWSQNYQGKANWYLSLCHIKQRKIENAKALLQEVVHDHSYNSEKAKHLLRELK